MVFANTYYDPLMEVRATLNTDTNTGGVDSRTGVGGAEIQKRIDELIVDALNRNVDFKPLVSRKPMDQLAHIWNVRRNLGSTSKAAFYAEGAAGTPYPSTKTELVATAKALRSDYEVSNLMLAASSSYYDALEDEARDALSQLALVEERSMLCGTDTSAYGFANAYDGLLQLMGSNATFADTATVFGLARSAARDELDVQLVTPTGGATSSQPLDLLALDTAIRKSDDAGGKGNNRLFLVSSARAHAIGRLLQSQQRFEGVYAGPAGFDVLTYKTIKIVGSRFMDLNGITWDGTTKTLSYADNAIYLLDMDHVEFRVLNGVDVVHVPVFGTDASQRADVRGGFFKTYGVFVMKRFDTQVLVYNLSAP